MSRNSGPGVEAVEDVIDEVADETAAFPGGKFGKTAHGFQLLWCGTPPGRRTQHGPSHPQGADLRVQRIGVRCRDLGDGHFASQHPPDGRDVDAEVAQCPYQA